jgi:hypothetical protein
VRLNDFDNELKTRQQDFESVMTIKKPEPVSFAETIGQPITETDMEKELRLRMEERQREMDSIHYENVIIQSESTSLKMENKSGKSLNDIAEVRQYEGQRKKVFFTEEIVDEKGMNEKMDIMLVEMSQLKQEIVDLKKMIGAIITRDSKN